MDSAKYGFSAKLIALTCALLLVSIIPTLALAQASGAILRGRVLLGDKPAAGAAVVATNLESGYTNRATTRENGSYVLVGLAPGNYRIKTSGQGFEQTSDPIRVQIGQTVSFDIQVPAPATAQTPSTPTTAPENADQSTATTTTADAGPTTEVLVVARPLIETRTSEVATNVTTEQIESLPQNNRNFMNFAALAPGVRINDKDTAKTFQAGALSANAVNVYIDGASYKNQVLNGGVAGQDSSRGNPFPQNAVREFRVITQNFKAEYEQASSAIITARTRSGTNEFDADGFVYYQNKDLVAKDDFAVEGEPKADFRRLQYGLSFGGPIIEDKMHFFVAYEANDQDRAERVTLGNQAYQPVFGQYVGAFTQPFKEDLFFGKVDFQPTDQQRLEVSYNYRNESDIKDFEGQNSYEAASNVKNKVKMARIAYTFDNSSWINEASISHMDYAWNPSPINPDIVGREFVGVIRIGGGATTQDVGQKVLTFKDDVTFTQLQWHGEHMVKSGVRVSKVDFNVVKDLNGNPLFRYLPEVSFDFPGEALYGTGDPDLSGDTTQYGFYLQDDWEATRRLTLNLGVRYDYDTNLLNVNYVTPPAVVAAASAFVPDRYFSDGNDRENPKDLIQPRLGFSFDLFDNQKTVLFGGVGRYFDRVLYNELLDERLRLQHQVRRFIFSSDGAPRNGTPTIQWSDAYLSEQALQNLIASGIAPNPEIFLVENDTRVPETIQASLGVRQRLADNWLTSLTFARNRSRHGFSYIFGNRNADGSCCAPVPGGFGNIILSTDDKQAWYNGVFLTLEKLYTQDSRWGMTFAYTYSEAEETGGDLFSLDFPTIADYPRHPTSADERHRVVFSAIAGIPWDMKVSTLITLGSGTGYTISDQTLGTGPGQTQYRYFTGRPERHSFIIPNAWAFRSVDLRLEKAVTFGDQQLSVVAEAFNVFDFENYDPLSYNGNIPPPGQPVNEKFGQPADLIEPGRRLQFGVTYKF
jgi:outer membrane receptor protein involved in Fe transport